MTKLKYAALTKEVLQRDYDELKTISAIARKYGAPVNSINNYMRRYKIKVARFLQPIYYINEDLFEIDVRHSEKGFYIAGFIAADGNISPNKKSTNVEMKIFLSHKDKDHLVKIKEAMDFTGPIGETSCLDKRNQKTYYSNYISVSCSSKIIIDLQNNFNIVPKKSLIYTFPSQIMGHKMLSHFLRGYFDGDGCFYKSKDSHRSVSFELLGTQSFLNDVKVILEQECALVTKNKIGVDKGIYRLRYGGKEDVVKIANYLYGDSTIYLQRKFDKIAHLLM